MKNWIEFKTLPEYFDFFAKIPEGKWCTGDFENKNGQMCALGHVGERLYSDGHPLRDLLRISNSGYSPLDAADINNGLSTLALLGDTPKERILNAIILKESGILDEI